MSNRSIPSHRDGWSFSENGEPFAAGDVGSGIHSTAVSPDARRRFARALRGAGNPDAGDDPATSNTTSGAGPASVNSALAASLVAAAGSPASIPTSVSGVAGTGAPRQHGRFVGGGDLPTEPGVVPLEAPGGVATTTGDGVPVPASGQLAAGEAESPANPASSPSASPIPATPKVQALGGGLLSQPLTEGGDPSAELMRRQRRHHVASFEGDDGGPVDGVFDPTADPALGLPLSVVLLNQSHPVDPSVHGTAADDARSVATLEATSTATLSGVEALLTGALGIPPAASGAAGPPAAMPASTSAPISQSVITFASADYDAAADGRRSRFATSDPRAFGAPASVARSGAAADGNAAAATVSTDATTGEESGAPSSSSTSVSPTVSGMRMLQASASLPGAPAARRGKSDFAHASTNDDTPGTAAAASASASASASAAASSGAALIPGPTLALAVGIDPSVPLPAATLENIVAQISSLFVSDAATGRREIRLTLGSGDLDGTSVTISEEGGAWKVDFTCTGAAASATLQASADTLARKLSDRLRRTVNVRVDGVASPDTVQGRAGR
jgi:hypothetical protein